MSNNEEVYSEKSNKTKVKNLISRNITKFKEKYPLGLNETMNTNVNFPQAFNKAIDRSKTRKEMIRAKQNTRKYISGLKNKNSVDLSEKFDSDGDSSDDFSKAIDRSKTYLENLRFKREKIRKISSDSNFSKKKTKTSDIIENTSPIKDELLMEDDDEIQHSDNLKIKKENEGYDDKINKDHDEDKSNDDYNSNRKSSNHMDDGTFSGKLKKLHKNYRDSYFVHLCNKVMYSNIYFIFMYVITILSCASIIFENPKLKQNKHYDLIFIQDIIFASVFSFDLILKLFANGIVFSRNGYFKRFICWIDLFTVIISIINITSSRDYFQSIRLLKLCYIMRFIYMQEGLRIVTVAIWKTIPSIFVAIIPYIFYLLICSLIGISLFVDKGWQCSDTSILEKNKCKGNYIDRFDKNVTRHWIPYSVTFDNFFDGLLSTFVISHQEAWPDIMYRYINLSADDTVRPEKIHLNYSIFFVFAILIGNWLFLSVITAVTFNSLKRNQDILSGMQVSFFFFFFFFLIICIYY